MKEHVTIRFSEKALDSLINQFTKWAEAAHKEKIKKAEESNDPSYRKYEIDMEAYWCGNADAFQDIKNNIIKKESEEPKMKELENQVAYVAHPYGGHEVNRELTTMELLKLKKESEEPKMKELENQVAYVAHPYGGHEVNRELTTMELLKLSKAFPPLVLLSPLHNFEWVEYIADRHTQDLFQNKCNALLDRSDILILTGAWMDSRGCMQEFERAKEQGKPIFIFKHGGLFPYREGDQYGD